MERVILFYLKLKCVSSRCSLKWFLYAIAIFILHFRVYSRHQSVYSQKLRVYLQMVRVFWQKVYVYSRMVRESYAFILLKLIEIVKRQLHNICAQLNMFYVVELR